MKWFLSVTLLVLFGASIASKCDVNKGSLMVMDFIDIFRAAPLGNIITFNKYEKNKHFAALILAADVTHLCKAFVNKFDDVKMLSFNEIPIDTFDDGLFVDAPHIENLEFDGARVTHIKSGIFKNAAKLEEIKFVNTPIEKVDQHAFDNLPALEDFTISNAKLTHVNEHWFRNCPSIVSVDFSGNKIKTIVAGNFAFLKPGELHKVNLANNRIKTILPLAFNLNTFKSLDLKGNRVKSLLPMMFNNVNRSEEIDLTNNRFECMDDRTIKALKHFDSVILDDNSVEEDCNKDHIISKLKNVQWNN